VQSRGNWTGRGAVIRDGCSVAVGRLWHMGRLCIGSGHRTFSDAAWPVLTRDLPLRSVTCDDPCVPAAKPTIWAKETAA
jgi:hypothetical protein